MKKNLAKEIFSLPYKEFFGLCLAINVVVAVLVIVLKGFLPPVVPLYYGLPVGEEQLVPRIFLVIPSVVTIFVTIVNVLIAKLSKVNFMQKVLIGITVAITLLASITTVKIFFLVASFHL